MQNEWVEKMVCQLKVAADMVNVTGLPFTLISAETAPVIIQADRDSLGYYDMLVGFGLLLAVTKKGHVLLGVIGDQQIMTARRLGCSFAPLRLLPSGYISADLIIARTGDWRADCGGRFSPIPAVRESPYAIPDLG